jgi:hypothetical protein
VPVSERGGREGGEAAPRYSSATGGGAALVEPLGALPKRAVICFACWRHRYVKGMQNTVHARQKPIFLPILHYIVGLSLINLLTWKRG